MSGIMDKDQDLSRQKITQNETIKQDSRFSCFEGKQYLSLCRLSPNLVTYHYDMASIPLGEVNRESCSVSAYEDPLMSCTY